MELKELIKASVEGKRQAQNELYNRFAAQLMMVCLRYSKDRQEAEEILQEGFVSAFRNLHRFRFDGSFEGWLRRIMVNQALQQYRSKTPLHALVTRGIDSIYAWTEDDMLSKISVKELLLMIQQLPQAYRLVFNLYVFEGLKHREIAKLLGIAEGTSKSNLYDARLLLQEAINNNWSKETGQAHGS